jgi:hypothetical protein
MIRPESGMAETTHPYVPQRVGVKFGQFDVRSPKMWWKSSADKPGNLSLIQNVVQILCGDGSAPENT